MAGRKPLPTRLRMLRGNPGKRRINQNEPQPKPLLAECPKWLKGEGRAEWERIAPILYNLGVLTEIDISALEKYCVAHSRWRQAEAVIDKARSLSTVSGNGSPCALPEVALSQKYLKITQSYLAEFGMTPSSRSGVSIVDNSGKNSAVEELLFGPRD